MSYNQHRQYQSYKRNKHHNQTYQTAQITSCKTQWINYQLENAKKITLTNCNEVSDENLKYVGGLDVTYSTTQPNLCLGCLAICEYPSCKLVHSITIEKEVTVPYIPGFLAFRENEMYKELIDKCRKDTPQYFPQLFMVDGNGIYHPRRFGSACQIGIENDVPALGAAKTVLYVDGITPSLVTHLTLKTPRGGMKKLYTDDGEYISTMIRSGEGKHPIIVSPGHKISMERSVEIVRKMLIHKIPEPIFLADKLSRDIYEKQGKIQPKKKYYSSKKVYSGK